MILIEGLRHAYQAGTPAQVEALRGITLEIQPGEFVAVVGHNGCGKSTLARHLNALLTPSGGRVTVEGLDTSRPEQVWEIRQRVGMVFQNPDSQLVATQVEEEVAFGPENLGLDPEVIRTRLNEALGAVGLAGFQLREPHLLSGGQKQRLAIAGILAMRPRYLVLDEPMAMLDPRGRREVHEVVERLNREEGITVVLITHDMREAAGAGRVLVMSEGKVVMDEPPRRLFGRVEELRQLRLDVPPMPALAYELKERGLPLAGEVLSVEEMALALGEMLKRGGSHG